MASFSLVLLTGQPASGAGKLLTPADEDQATNHQATEASPPVLREIRPSGPPITLGISGGTLLHLPGEARTVYVADPDVADVQVQSTQRQYVYINAKKPGTTAVYAVDTDGHILLSKDVEVTPRPVTIIRREKQELGEPQPPPNYVVLPFQSTAAGTAAAPATPALPPTLRP